MLYYFVDEKWRPGDMVRLKRLLKNKAGINIYFSFYKALDHNYNKSTEFQHGILSFYLHKYAIFII